MIVRATTLDGQPVEFDDKIAAQGGMKDIYFSPDRRYAVGFYRTSLDPAGQERLNAIVGAYRQGIFGMSGGDYWQDLFCWPQGIVNWQGRTGVVTPFFSNTFFFQHGAVRNDFLAIKGREKEGKWFASASNRNKYLDPREKGTWLNYLKITLQISRAVRRLHAAGLAHSDLSYKNILIDPVQGRACIIDIDSLVVPGKFPPDVVGTPDFIAPEVMATQHLDRHDRGRVLPSEATDRHALAVLIYMYLFYRHPLRGGKVHDLDPGVDEELTMGRQAVFIEHPQDDSNRVRVDQLRPAELPWGDPASMPCTMAGPILGELFNKAFVDGLHAPHFRPSAADWENGLLRTIDMIQPCANNGCEMGWYVFDNTTAPKCPLCQTPYGGKLPVLNLYSIRHSGSYQPDNHRIMVWNGQSLFPWHVNRKISPNEHLTVEQKKRQGYFQMHQGEWILVNEAMPQLFDITANTPVPVGGYVRLAHGGQLLLSREEGGRLIQVQLVGG